MKKHVKDFINQIEKEFPSDTNFSVLGRTETFINASNQPINIDMVVVNERMSFCIHSCGCNNCKNIVGIDIFYGHSSDLNDVNQAMNLIKKVAPTVPIVLTHELEFLDDMLK